jgi:ankyrin repeat protein
MANNSFIYNTCNENNSNNSSSEFCSVFSEASISIGTVLEKKVDELMVAIEDKDMELSLSIIRDYRLMGAMYDKYGTTPLHFASSEGADEIVSALISGTDQIDAYSSCGYTALHYASSAGHIKTVRLLVEAGANVEAIDADGNTPFTLASRMGHFEVIRILHRQLMLIRCSPI